jgi:deazaflavin-dependent oxidoreductase (nitroreductase family)
MAKTNRAPRSVRVANVPITTLLRAGLSLVGPALVIGNYPLYLLTVRGRKSGQPRTVPLVIIERKGKRYVGSPYGIVDWVRNLREAGEATLTRGRRSETVNARELPTGEVAIPSLATLASPRTRHLRSLIVRRSAIQSLSWKGGHFPTHKPSQTWAKTRLGERMRSGRPACWAAKATMIVAV